ncbi:MAG: hypothetical protein VKL39_08200 [Leptolyngbyaceae bacterium]|nr:hypothetical protein [Leptolyngbyaceae bacterium]
MKHASATTLEQLTDLLNGVRRHCPPIKEKKPGVFYFKSAAFLHFHDDPAGIFADLKVDGDWVRYPVNTPQERTTLLTEVEKRVC